MGDLSDSEEPPHLVDVEHDGARLALAPTHKVPITIITGKEHGFEQSPTSDLFQAILELARLHCSTTYSLQSMGRRSQSY